MIEATSALRLDHAIPAKSAKTVLIVEDDRVLRACVNDMLEEIGNVAIETESATTALAVLKAQGVGDLLLTDLVLPGLDGSRLAKEEKRLRPGITTLFMTGYGYQAEHGEESMTLNKPFSFEQLAARLREALDR